MRKFFNILGYIHVNIGVFLSLIAIYLKIFTEYDVPWIRIVFFSLIGIVNGYKLLLFKD